MVGAAGVQDSASDVPGTQCGPYGERLVVQVADELARLTPERIYATISRSDSDLDEGFRDITVREFVNAVNATAWWVEQNLGRSRDFNVIAYIGTSDIRYAIYLFAAIKTGYKLMIPSVRNSESQMTSVFEEAKCSIVCYTKEFESKITALRSSLAHLNGHVVPDLPILLSSTPPPYPYEKSWAEARTDPIITAHSSGSTGNPKPTTITNGVYSVYDNHRKIPKIPGRRIQSYELLEFQGGGRFYNPYPPFHLAGLFAMTIMPFFYTCTITMGPTEKPPTGEILSQVMRQIPLRAAWCPPTVIEQLLQQEGGLEQAGKLDWIMYTGGPLAPSAGDRLCHVTSLCQLYGSTETGPHTALVPLPENWNWFEWHPLFENGMDPMGDGTYEMVVNKDPSQDWIRHLSQAYPHLERWRTNDLFIQKPGNAKLWRFVGRRDDVLVLSNGEKFNPVNMEGVIVGHPRVRGALIVGTARFQASLLVEPAPGLSISNEKFVEDLWPTVEKANSIGPAHGRIFRSKVIVASHDKPFIRAGKGTVIRGRTTRLYADEIDRLYAEEHENIAFLPDVPSSKDVDELKAWIRTCIQRLVPDYTFSDDDDLFAIGMDSLQTLELTKILRRGIVLMSERKQAIQISAATIYAYPSVNEMASFLHATVLGEAQEHPALPQNGDSIRTRAQRMEKLVVRYTADFPRLRTPCKKEGFGVALTGSTGSLGTHVLEKLIKDPNVSSIYCLNRSPDARERHLTTFEAQGKRYDLDGKVRFFVVQFGIQQLGLSAELYTELQGGVDVIIHNAWKVDFNHRLESFENTHIRGVRNIIDWSLTSNRRPRIFFVSSISTVGNWGSVHNTSDPVPEIVLTDTNTSLAMGYGESKHVAEMVLDASVREAGVKASILRVGQVAGPLTSNSGQWNRTEWFPSLLQTSKTLGYLPGEMNTIDWIPVDELAQIIVDLVHHVDADGRDELQQFSTDTAMTNGDKYSGNDQPRRGGGALVFNLINPASTPWDSLLPTIQSHWARSKDRPTTTRIVSFGQWLTALRAQEKETSDLASIPAYKIMDFYENLAREASSSSERSMRQLYDVKNALRCSETMKRLKPVNAEAMETWLKQWHF